MDFQELVRCRRLGREDEACRRLRRRRPGKPGILVKPGPRTPKEATWNLRAFSDETRCTTIPDPKPDPELESELEPRPPPAATETSRDPAEACRPPPFPPLPACYGWMRLPADDFKLLDPWLRAERLRPDEDGQVYGIVYEYVPATQERDLEMIQAHLDFFHAVGFYPEPYNDDNWHGGRLIDLGDVNTVFKRDWHGSCAQHMDVKNYCRLLLLYLNNTKAKTLVLLQSNGSA